MRRLIVLAFVFVISAPGLGADELTEALDRYVSEAAADWEVPGLAIAVVKDGDLVFAKGYGVLELGGQKKVDENTLFAIGSTTKAMTAATIGLLVDDGRVGWDDPATRHLPELQLHDPWVTRELTVRDLLTHRAGLGNADLLWYGSDRTREEIIAKLALVEPAYSMRDGFIYQNIMYIAAGELAARVAGTTWEQMVSSRLFDPLGMTKTVPNLAATESLENVARPHDRIDGSVVSIDNASVDSAAPAGAVWSSVSDMSRWIRMLLAEGRWNDEQILSSETVTELLRPQELLDLEAFYPAIGLIEPHWTTYGLGWFQADYDGRAVSFHTGSIDGMAAIVGLIPDEDLGVVVLENRDHAECRHALMWKVFDLWGGTPEGRDWSEELKKVYEELAAQAEERERTLREKRVEGTRPTLPLDRYAGTYRHPIYDDLRVTMRHGALRFALGPEFAGSLTHWHYDTFEAQMDQRWRGELPIRFSLDTEGNPAQVDLAGLIFERVPADGLPENQATRD